MTYNKIKEKDLWLLESSNNYDSQEKTLKPGIYSVQDFSNLITGFIPGFKPLKSNDTLIKFSSGIISEVIGKIDNFFSENSIAAYKYLKIAHKLGIILHGPPGTGKTCTSFLIMEAMVNTYKAIAFDFTNHSLLFMLKTLELIRGQQDSPMVVFYDEFENLAENLELLPFLDGSTSLNGVVFIGCTNFLDQIPKRIKKRKSRIKYLFEINSLPIAVYKEYIKEKLPEETKEFRAEFSYKAEEAGLTIDQFKHAIIDNYIEKVSVDDAIKEAKTFK